MASDDIPDLAVLEAVIKLKQQTKIIQVCYNTLGKLKQYHTGCINLWIFKRNELSSQIQELSEKLKEAQQLVYTERQKSSAAIRDRNTLIAKLNAVRDVVIDNPRANFLKDKLSFLNDRVETILELDNTDIMMSELSNSLDNDHCSSDISVRSLRNKRTSRQFPQDKPSVVSQPKRSRGNRTSEFSIDGQGVVAKTTVTVTYEGPISTKSVIESFPSTSKQQISLKNVDTPICLDSESDEELQTVTPKKLLGHQTNLRLHNWVQKSHITGEICSACSKKINFLITAVKCSNCKAIAHISCKYNVPLPCVPVAKFTPNSKNGKFKTISDLAPHTKPMVPSIIVHCIREVERRGLQEVGLYRIPASDKEVKTLKQKLVKAKGVVDLTKENDIHTICECLMDFLRSLKETLIPQNSWNEFAAATNIVDDERKKNKLFHLVNKLPEVNRDTLAFIALHLQKVANAPRCEMPVANLAKMFGPSIVGYLSSDPLNILSETNILNQIMADLLLLPKEYWENILYLSTEEKNPSQNIDSGFFNSQANVKTVAKVNFFNTP